MTNLLFEFWKKPHIFYNDQIYNNTPSNNTNIDFTANIYSLLLVVGNIRQKKSASIL